MSDELPEGWFNAQLADVADVALGKMLDRAKRTRGTPLPYLRNANVRWGGFNLADLSQMPFEDDELQRYAVEQNDLLVCEGGEPGRAAVWPGSKHAIKYQKALLRVRPSAGISPSWVMYSLFKDSAAGVLEEYFTGSTIKHFPQQAAIKYKLPLAPLAEQRRIVAKVEALLAEVNAARDRLAKVPGILKRFRQSVFAAACSGNLSQDQNSPAFSDAESEKWSRLRLEEIASSEPRSIQSGPFGSNLHHSEFRETGKLVIGIDNVGDGVFLRGRQNRISEAKYRELEKYSARPGDVLVTVMATVGRVCVIPEDIEPAIITKHVYRITANREVMLPRFLACILRGDPGVIEQLREQIRGQTRPGINGEILKSLELPVPPIASQRAIVRRVETLLQVAGAVEGHVAFGIARANGVTQAILAKAFRGELVPTEAELARAEGRDYEPAVVLLARIRAERERAAPSVTARKRSGRSKFPPRRGRRTGLARQSS